jgi:hypothetical protein
MANEVGFSPNLLLGLVLGYFFSTSFFIFSAGIVVGVVIQEQFGSVYKFGLFVLDISKQYLQPYQKYLPNFFIYKNNVKE